MNHDKFEIERKYLIAYPDPEALRREAEGTRIVQTYLVPEKPGRTDRVRARGQEGAWVYTHTVKERVSDLKCIEIEREISREDYEALLRRADPACRVIEKTRWVLPWEGQNFEIDLYPFWSDRAILEIELEDEAQPVRLPPLIRVLKEVTHDRRYSNAALAGKIPMEQIETLTGG